MSALPTSLVIAAIGLAACSDAASKPPPAARQAITTPARPGYARRRALIAQAKAAQATGDWASCSTLFEAAHGWADAARCVTHTGDLARGLDDVQRALARSAAELERMRGDPELAALQRDPRWRELLAEAETRLASYRGTVNRELERLARADAGRPIDPRDLAERRARVGEIVASGGATLTEDYLHAATVYYRADTAADAARARELALTALARDPDSDEVRWLAAAAEDRRLEHEGKPQKYGTQYVVTGGKRVLWNVDPAITDAERERWSVPSLAEAIAGDAETAAAVLVGEPAR
jgi:hypothetical protein